MSSGGDSMSADEYQKYLKKGTKPKKPPPDTISADQFRRDHVDQQEHGLQARCVEWFKMAYPSLLIVAIPNAAKRSFALAAMLKAEGMVTGFPDLMLAYMAKGFGALFIEMKTVKGEPSPEQLVVHAYLRSVGYEVVMPRTFEEFKFSVEQYLSDY